MCRIMRRIRVNLYIINHFSFKTIFMKLNLNFPKAVIIVTACILAQSCNKIASNLQYDLSMQTGSIDIKIAPISDTSAGLTMGTVTSVYSIDSFVKANTGNVLGAHNISSAKMSSCTLTLLNPSTTNNFANFQNSAVSFYTNSNATPFNIANITGNPDIYASTLNVPVDATAEMKGYLNGNQLTYSLVGKMRRATTDTIICRVQVTMNVHVHA